MAVVGRTDLLSSDEAIQKPYLFTVIMSAKAAIEYVCNCLAFFGITTLNPEVFRQAKLGNAAVVRAK
jgi:hypothetical protein